MAPTPACETRAMRCATSIVSATTGTCCTPSAVASAVLGTAVACSATGHWRDHRHLVPSADELVTPNPLVIDRHQRLVGQHMATGQRPHGRDQIAHRAGRLDRGLETTRAERIG